MKLTNMTYQCEACGHGISKLMYINGLRLRGAALCFLHQATQNIVAGKKMKKDGWADLMNAPLYKKYRVSEEQAKKDMSLDYFKNL